MEKKKMKLWKKILIAILVIIVVLVIAMIPVINKVTIISSLSDKFAENVKMENIYQKVTLMGQDEETFFERYYKDGVEKTVGTNELWTKSIEFRDKDVHKNYIDYKDGSKALIISKNYPSADGEVVYNKNLLSYIAYYTKDTMLIGKITAAIKTKIDTEIVDGKNCYVLKLEDEHLEDNIFYIEKDTGLTLKMVHKFEADGMQKENIQKYEYSFGTVTDEDMKEPENASEYVVKDTRN